MNFRWREYARFPTSDTGLPLSSKISEKNSPSSVLGLRSLQIPKRYSRLLLSLVITLGFIFFFFDTGLLPRRSNPHPYPQVLRIAPDDSGLPPLYEAYTEYEKNLLQQQDDHFAERKYIFTRNHAYGAGWGNILQEMIHGSLVASESGRG